MGDQQLLLCLSLGFIFFKVLGNYGLSLPRTRTQAGENRILSVLFSPDSLSRGPGAWSEAGLLSNE